MVEGQGFEPWEALPSLVFKTSAFDRSATPPTAVPITKIVASQVCANRSESGAMFLVRVCLASSWPPRPSDWTRDLDKPFQALEPFRVVL